MRQGTLSQDQALDIARQRHIAEVCIHRMPGHFVCFLWFLSKWWKIWCNSCSSLSLSLPHTNTNTLTLTHSLTHSLSHIYIYSVTHTNAHSLSLSFILSLSHIYSLSLYVYISVIEKGKRSQGVQGNGGRLLCASTSNRRYARIQCTLSRFPSSLLGGRL